MAYFVKTITIKTGFFGVSKDKMDSSLADELNALEVRGYEIVSAAPVLNNSNDFDYQIIYKKK